MKKENFTKDQFAVIYESVKHLATYRDILETDNYIGQISRGILKYIEKEYPDVASAWYVHDKIID